MPGTYVEKILLFPKGKSGFQQEVFPEMGSHHLKAHGKFHAAFPDGSAGNGHGGEAGQVGGDRGDVEAVHRQRLVLLPEPVGCHRRRGRDQDVVVLPGGGRNAQIPGYRVGGKSGTSQKLDSADEKARIASFVAVAPIDDPQFLCLVCLDEPHSWTTAGGSLSAPVCAEVLEQTLVYRGVPRTTEAPAASTAETAADLPADGDSFDGA